MVSLSNIRPSYRWVVVSHCSFTLLFSNKLMTLNIFVWTYWPSISLLWQSDWQILCPPFFFFKLKLGCLSSYWLDYKGFSSMLDTSSLSHVCFVIFFFLVCGLSIYSLNNVFQRAKAFWFDKVQFIFFLLWFTLYVCSKNTLPDPHVSQRFSLMFSSTSFIFRFRIYV